MYSKSIESTLTAVFELKIVSLMPSPVRGLSVLSLAETRFQCRLDLFGVASGDRFTSLHNGEAELFRQIDRDSDNGLELVHENVSAEYVNNSVFPAVHWTLQWILTVLPLHQIKHRHHLP